MNIKRAFSLIVFFILSIQINHAQDKLKLKETRSEVILNMHYQIDHIDKLEDGNYVNLTENYIYLMDENLSIIKETKLPEFYIKRKIEYKEMFVLDDKIVVIVELLDVKHNKVHLFSISINKNSLEWNGSFVKIAELNTLKGRNSYTENFRFKRSKNGKYLLIFGINDTQDKSGKQSSNESINKATQNEKETFSFWVLDQKLDLINYKLNQSVLSDKSELTYKEILCDNSGNVAISLSDKKIKKTGVLDKFRNESLDKDDQTELTYRVLFFKKNGDKFEFKTSKKIYVTQLSISFSPDENSIDLVGVSLEGVNGYGVPTGVFIEQLNTDNLTSTFTRIVRFDPEDFLSKEELKKWNKNVPFNIPTINNILGIVYDSNGNVGVALEKRWSVSQEKRSTVYHYNDIVVFSNLNEEDEYTPLIVKRDKISVLYMEKGAIIVEYNGAWYLWSEIYIYKINTENLTYSTYQMYNSGLEEDKILNDAMLKYPSLAVQNPDAKVINNNEFIAMAYVNRNKHKKNISIKLN